MRHSTPVHALAAAAIALLTASVSAADQAPRADPEKPGSPFAKVLQNARDDAVCPLAEFAGGWVVEIETDEGWPGSGVALIQLQFDRGCAIVERGVYEMRAPDRTIASEGLSVVAWDSLDGRYEAFFSDSRSYGHHLAGDQSNDGVLVLEQLNGGLPPLRRATLRWIDDGVFQRVWEGRSSATDPWRIRVIRTYRNVGE